MTEKSKQPVSRRQFLMTATAAGAITAGSGSLLAACGGGSKTEPSSGAATTEPRTTAALDCMDTSGLTQQEIQTRNALQYVDMSPEAAKNCANCNLFTQPAEAGTCGGCQIMKGPISPKGYCASWVAVQA